MTENKNVLMSAFIKMMRDLEGITQNDTIYQESISDFGGIVKLQWNICGVLGYQIFKNDDYTYKLGEELNDPDVYLKIKHKDLALRFLNGEHLGFKYAPRRDYKGKFKIMYVDDFKDIKTEKGERREQITRQFITARAYNDDFKHPLSLLKLPSLRSLKRELSVGAKLKDEEYGAYIPINLPIKYENHIIPYSIFKHFIERASNLVIMSYCACRKFNECSDYNQFTGCLYMGDDTLDMKLTDDKGRVVSKEEALEHVRNAIDKGLIPVIGRVMAEARLYGVEDTGHFLASCFCCPCCCINGKALTFGPSNLSIYERIAGITVNTDEDLCNGCGKCVDVCVFRGREMKDGRPKLNNDLCLGCGRCVEVCPTEAITIEIDDISRVEELIGKVEGYADVRPQSTL
ncbi:MAG: 4Fe-4S binding protein [Promethearchaeota archaeon]